LTTAFDIGTIILKHFPLSVNRRDSQRAANKILWPSQAEEAGNGFSNDLRVRVIQVVEGGAGGGKTVCDWERDGDPLGEALAGDRQL
jgi:hypothetical protein